MGKDNLPVNRYCPRETPAWQKKITFFYDRNAANGSSISPEKNQIVPEQIVHKTSKRTSSDIEEPEDMITNGGTPLKKMKINNNMETDAEETNELHDRAVSSS